tara:strand:- start:31 stop:204 length:174 start_codon:yes stop_codon:yes gene_type:complete
MSDTTFLPKVYIVDERIKSLEILEEYANEAKDKDLLDLCTWELASLRNEKELLKQVQ